MTHKQLLWAKAHDWFYSATSDGTVLVEEILLHGDGRVTTTIKRFTSFAALKRWAGY
jgi:hypothetical protein